MGGELDRIVSLGAPEYVDRVAIAVLGAVISSGRFVDEAEKTEVLRDGRIALPLLADAELNGSHGELDRFSVPTLLIE
ncbi:hypothetical protein ABIF74_011703 [Bradyrhizobium japonicum]